MVMINYEGDDMPVEIVTEILALLKLKYCQIVCRQRLQCDIGMAILHDSDTVDDAFDADAFYDGV